MRFVTTCAVTVLFFVGSASAQTRPWLLSPEQRVAVRLDPQAIAERARVHAEQRQANAGVPARFVIDGKRNPELFMPNELMASLLSTCGADAPSNDTARIAHQPDIHSFGWDGAQFWRDLDLAAAEFNALVKKSSGPDRSPEMSRQICGARAAALASMRRQYDRFDEFLYTTIAPRRVVVSDVIADADWVLWLERGCK